MIRASHFATPLFYSGFGNTVPSANVYAQSFDNAMTYEENKDTKYKPVTIIKTPRVKAVAQKYIGCDTIKGWPLEDSPLGAGAHWEARVTGPEFMSYGANMGQSYVSDLTLAFLEDTNQYWANKTEDSTNCPMLSGTTPLCYNNAGALLKFLNSSSNQFVADPFDTIQGPSFAATKDANWVDPPMSPPGALRWGAGVGCSFVDNAPADWPAAYKCYDAKTGALTFPAGKGYGCTPDKRMSARCVVSAAYFQESQDASCGTWQKPASSTDLYFYGTYDADKCIRASASDCTGDGCNIHPSMRYFTNDGAAAAAVAASGQSQSYVATTATTGGFIPYNDYVPVSVGYWDCSYTQNNSANSKSSSTASDTSQSALTSLYSSLADTTTVGGQSRCPSCRCFISSLQELNRGVNPEFPSYGLCYRKNCYRKDYLQIALLSAYSTQSYWYKCPTQGGQLWIPGYTGAFTCPPAEEFCRDETITGLKFPETDIFYEAIFW